MSADLKLLRTPAQLARGYSLEITASNADITALRQLRPVIPGGTQVSTTFLPGDALTTLIETSMAVQRLGFTPVPHIAARKLRSRLELDEFLAVLSNEATLDRVFVIAGDTEVVQGPFRDALALIESGLLGDRGVRVVGIGGYPDGHPKIATDALWRALRQKRAALLAAGHRVEIFTQFCFDANPVLSWLAQLRAQGIHERVRIGIPGPASVRTLLRFAARCGVAASAKAIGKYGLNLTKLMSSVGPEQLLGDLQVGLDPEIHGDVSIHLFPFGGLQRTVAFMGAWAAR